MEMVSFVVQHSSNKAMTYTDGVTKVIGAIHRDHSPSVCKRLVEAFG
jgi:hypothetical protein